MSESFAHRQQEGPSRRRGRRWGLVGLSVGLILASPGGSGAREPSKTIVLGEAIGRGASSQVKIELKAQGLFRPGPQPGQLKDGAKMPKPLAITIQTRLKFSERVLDLFDDPAAIKIGRGDGPGTTGRGRPRKAARHVIEAVSALSGEIRPRASSLRPEVALLVAERRRQDGPVLVFSPAGPLTWTDLELVEVEGDPLVLADILPARPVALGQSWRVGNAAVAGISGYDVIGKNSLDATLESFDDARAQVRIRGRIEGSLQGAPGAMACDGLLTFDRRMGWIERVEINRNESRRPGPIEAGMDVKSTLTMTRQAETPPRTLGDAELARYSLEVTPRGEMLLEYGPDDRSSFLHDRSWHLYWGNSKLSVLKRLDRGRVVAQCNLVVGPPAGRGRHQDPARFQEEVRRALGQRFVNFIGKGAIDGDPAGGYRYKVGVQGREGDLDVVWYYYLVASPEGDQLVVTYTLTAQDAASFGEQDVEMIRTLRWLPAPQSSRRP